MACTWTYQVRARAPRGYVHVPQGERARAPQEAQKRYVHVHLKRLKRGTSTCTSEGVRAPRGTCTYTSGGHRGPQRGNVHVHLRGPQRTSELEGVRAPQGATEDLRAGGGTCTCTSEGVLPRAPRGTCTCTSEGSEGPLRCT